ncbi:MAG TPA: sigma-70 family RNA polymerase sigma factor [Chitinophaga sp.]
MQEKEAIWLTAIYRETFPQVARAVQRLGGDLDTAKDLFHDALVIYLEKRNNNTLDIRVSVKAYLVGITRILWMQKFRQDCRQQSLDTLGDQPDTPADLYAPETDKTRSLRQHLQAAGKKCLQLLQAFYYEQRSMDEIAREFHYKSAHSATVQKYKCLEKVRETIKRADIYEEATA